MITIKFNDYYYIQLTLLDILEASLKWTGVHRSLQQTESSSELSPFKEWSDIVTFY